MMEVFYIKVDYTNRRPLVPDEHTAWVAVSADSVTEAELVAAQMVGSGCTMVTRTTFLYAEV